MSGVGLIEMLAARLGGRGARRSAPALREVLASAMPNRAPVTAYEPIASRLDDPMAEGAMLSGADDMAPPMPNAIRTGPDAGPVQRVRAYRGASVPYEGNDGIQFWSDDADIASSNALGQGANVTRADLDLGRTLEVDARGSMWNELSPEGISDEALRAEFAKSSYTMDPSRAVGPYGWFDIRTTDRLGQIARRHGYDSVTLRNVIEGGSPLDEAGRGRPTTTYMIAGDRARFAPALVDIKLNDSRVQGGGPWRAITAPRNPETFNPATAWRNGEFTPEANVGGYLQYDPTRWRVIETHLDDDLRSQGNGVRMYEDLIARARKAGQPHIESDGYVSESAQRVYAALERRGYTVTRREGRNGPTFRVETERAPRTGPNAGSDRNALQRALRERMERE